MEGDQRHYELRSRSRSRSHTPMVFNQTLEPELADHHYDLRSRSRERSHTPGEVTSTRRSGSRSLPGSAGKQREKSMDTIAEHHREESKTEISVSNEKTRRPESTASSVTRKVERRSERQRVKRQIFANGQNENKEDSSSESKADDNKSKRKSVTPRRMITSDYSSEEGEKEDPPSRPGSAYEIYKQAGDWWNVFPKTDYTYSQKSQFRYEIAPGVLAMPNMSRPSIHSDGNSTNGSVNSLSQQNLSQYSQGTREESLVDERSYDGGEARETIEQNRLNEMSANRLFGRLSHEESSMGRSAIYRKTHVEHYNSHREFIYGDSGRSLRHERYGTHSQVESDAELDEALLLRNASREQKWKITQWIQTIRQTIVSWLFTCVEIVNVKILGRGNVSSHDYQRYQESKWKRAWAPLDRLMQYLYLLLVRILFLDTWLLSRVSSVRQQLKQRRSKLLWLILLPPLLLAGAYIAQKHSLATMEKLQTVENALTETTYRIYNDAMNLTFFDYGKFANYIKTMQNISLPLMNVSSIRDYGWNVTW